MRLIDADELCVSLKETQKIAREWNENAKNEEIKFRSEGALATLCEVKLRIDEQPTVDAVPVVRCKNCKHHREDREINCMFHLSSVKEDWFCSEGK